MKKVSAIVLSLVLAFPAASLLAQQAPAPVKQPVQVAQGNPPPPSLFGMGALGTAAVAVGLVLVVANAVDGNDDAVASASATR